MIPPDQPHSLPSMPIVSLFRGFQSPGTALGGDYMMFPRLRLLQKISSLDQWVRKKHYIRFVERIDVSDPVEFDPSDLMIKHHIELTEGHEPESFGEGGDLSHSCWGEMLCRNPAQGTNWVVRPAVH